MLQIYGFIFLWAFNLQIYDVFIYVYIRILDLKLENPYKNGSKGQN